MCIYTYWNWKLLEHILIYTKEPKLLKTEGQFQIKFVLSSHGQILLHYSDLNDHL